MRAGHGGRFDLSGQIVGHPVSSAHARLADVPIAPASIWPAHSVEPRYPVNGEVRPTNRTAMSRASVVRDAEGVFRPYRLRRYRISQENAATGLYSSPVHGSIPDPEAGPLKGRPQNSEKIAR